MSEAETELFIHLGNAIVARRKMLGYTQQQLADMVGLARTSIANIEAGNQRAPIRVFLHLAQALELPFARLLPAEWRPKMTGDTP